MRIRLDSPWYSSTTYHANMWKNWPKWMPFWFGVCRIGWYISATEKTSHGFRFFVYWNRRLSDNGSDIANGACIGFYIFKGQLL